MSIMPTGQGKKTKSTRGLSIRVQFLPAAEMASPSATRQAQIQAPEPPRNSRDTAAPPAKLRTSPAAVDKHIILNSGLNTPRGEIIASAGGLNNPEEQTPANKMLASLRLLNFFKLSHYLPPSTALPAATALLLINLY